MSLGLYWGEDIPRSKLCRQVCIGVRTFLEVSCVVRSVLG